MLEHPILAIDHGDSRVGLACTDPVGIAVHPLATVPKGSALEEVATYIRQKGIKLLVIGLPLLKDGAEGESAEKARAFASTLKEVFSDIPQQFIDESFTTVDAARKLHGVGLNAKKQKGVIDQVAAMEILSRYLNENDSGFSEEIPFPH